jgi:hypothetical protein
MAIIYFERCVDALMPDTSVQDEWCMSNHASVYYRACEYAKEIGTNSKVDESINSAILLIRDSTKDINNLVETMCGYPPHFRDRNYGHTVGPLFRWNFTPLIEDQLDENDPSDPISDIEWRQAPGSDTAAKAVSWVTFALGFIQSAIARDTDYTGAATLNDLKVFVTEGVKVSGCGDPNAVDWLFDGKTDDSISKIVFRNGWYYINSVD